MPYLDQFLWRNGDVVKELKLGPRTLWKRVHQYDRLPWVIVREVGHESHLHDFLPALRGKTPEASRGVKMDMQFRLATE